MAEYQPDHVDRDHPADGEHPERVQPVLPNRPAAARCDASGHRGVGGGVGADAPVSVTEASWVGSSGWAGILIARILVAPVIPANSAEPMESSPVAVHSSRPRAPWEGGKAKDGG
ncbi:hypothetical protein GCM10027615_42280 [Plantactinospora veratri]